MRIVVCRRVGLKRSADLLYSGSGSNFLCEKSSDQILVASLCITIEIRRCVTHGLPHHATLKLENTLDQVRDPFEEQSKDVILGSDTTTW